MTQEPISSESASLSPRTRGWVAVAIIVVFIALTAVMVSRVGAGETEWTRLAFIYGGVEVFVVAAIGFLFGAASQEKAVKATETKARHAQESADSNAEGARVAAALRAALKAMDTERPASRPQSGEGLSTEKVGGFGAAQRLADDGDLVAYLLALAEHARSE